jgi:hypothetical protein
MAPKTADPGLGQIPPDGLVRELVTELGKAFDLSTALGDRTLGAAVEDRIRTLELGGTPEWGTDGSLKQLAKEESGALDFYYRPHLFPGMDPALRLGHRLQFDLLPRHLPEKSPLRIAALLESYCHLSGDLLGWRLEGNELFLWIVDVSGHGVRAGLAAATLHFLIDSIEEGLPPALFAERINEGVLAARNSDDPRALFATAIFLRVTRPARLSGSLPARPSTSVGSSSPGATLCASSRMGWSRQETRTSRSLGQTDWSRSVAVGLGRQRN